MRDLPNILLAAMVMVYNLLRRQTRDIPVSTVLILQKCVQYSHATPASLRLYSKNSKIPYEVTGRKCRAGVFLLEPTNYSCACITGIWGFYSHYCKKPTLIIGGDKYCFKLGSFKIAQAVIFGNPKYPFEPSLSHFREDYKIMTQLFRTDDNTVDVDSSSAFITVTNKPWTIQGNNGDKVCLNSTTDERRVFCQFDLTLGVIDNWLDITGVQRGCRASHVKDADFCHEINPPNDATLCTRPEDENVTTPATTEATTTTSTTEILSTSTEFSTTPLPDDFCKSFNSTEDIRDYWNHPLASICPRSITELVLTDQLKRFTIHKLNKEIRTRQLSLSQTEELLEIQENLFQITCPPEAVPKEFIQVLTEAFVMFLRDDFFYGVDETESSLYERIIFSLRTCLKRARPFDFLGDMDSCNSSLKITDVVLSGQPMKIVIDEIQSWRNYEIIIESGWKLFLNAHSYCYEDFLRQNDHHAYSLRMMQLFSNSIYEKWIQPLGTYMLYKYLLPNSYNLEMMMDNLDSCVGALTYNIKCPVWMDRSSRKENSQSQLDVGAAPSGGGSRQIEDTTSSSSRIEEATPGTNGQSQNDIDETPKSRKKRTIWTNYIQNNREETEIWHGVAHCLQSAEDPSYRLGFGRCAHP